jgi:hypothetical protein
MSEMPAARPIGDGWATVHVVLPSSLAAELGMLPANWVAVADEYTWKILRHDQG